MAEKEYIERINYCENICTCNRQMCDKSKCPIMNAPAADVAPVVHARWITEENTEGYRGDPQCTACKGLLDDEAVYGHTPGVDSFFYCPLCGAKMDGERYAKKTN